MLVDFYNYIAGDATLRSLIAGATVSASRIFPEVTKEGTQPPYLIYGTTHEGSLDEIMDQMTIQVSVFTSEYAQADADAIIFRLKTLLDLQDQIQGQIPSSVYNIYWAKHVGGLPGFVTDTREYHRAAMFAFKFRRK